MHPNKTGSRGALVSCAALRDYFRADPAISWGGYVAGCLLVLAREKGVEFDQGISILICSDVPEGARICMRACARRFAASRVRARFGWFRRLALAAR